MALLMDLRIDSTDWDSISGLETLCQRALDAGYQTVEASEDAAVDVLLTDDAALATLNEQWRGKTGPTDVLSFPAPANPEGFLGDIAITFGVSKRDAQKDGKLLSAHLSHLLIHGLLHLFGHDHVDDNDAIRMETLERAALTRLDISDPYS